MLVWLFPVGHPICTGTLGCTLCHAALRRFSHLGGRMFLFVLLPPAPVCLHVNGGWNPVGIPALFCSHPMAVPAGGGSGRKPADNHSPGGGNHRFFLANAVPTDGAAPFGQLGSRVSSPDCNGTAGRAFVLWGHGGVDRPAILSGRRLAKLLPRTGDLSVGGVGAGQQRHHSPNRFRVFPLAERDSGPYRAAAGAELFLRQPLYFRGFCWAAVNPCRTGCGLPTKTPALTTLLQYPECISR